MSSCEAHPEGAPPPLAGWRAFSGGSNASSLLNTSTVHDNGQVDTLTGTTGSAVDWFLAGLTDGIQHNKTGEVKTTIA
jgi:hypothetical protein